jgi:hypothetical protein
LAGVAVLGMEVLSTGRQASASSWMSSGHQFKEVAMLHHAVAKSTVTRKTRCDRLRHACHA